MADSIKIENEPLNVKCIVPNCLSRTIIDENQIHFFEVPEGREGDLWKTAVGSQYERKVGILGRTFPRGPLYCCELHFNVETDSIVTIDGNGSVVCKIRPGTFPSTRPTQSKRLCEILQTRNQNQMRSRTDIADMDLLQPTTRHYDSIVEMSALICRNFEGDIFTCPDYNPYDSHDHLNDDNETDIKFKPMMPLTIELMKRKPLYYMGLESSIFVRLLQIIHCTIDTAVDALMEMKIMLALRKHRLNEEYETLGDLFDIDKGTAEQYCEETRNVIANLYQSLECSEPGANHEESNDVKNLLIYEGSDRRVEESSSSSESDVKVYKYQGYVSHDTDFDSGEAQESETETETETEAESNASSSDYDIKREKKAPANTVQCPLCRRYVGRLDYHMETNHYHPQYVNKTLCGLCFARFQSHKLLREHQVEVHNGNACVCDICGKMYTKVSAVKEHIMGIHLKAKPFLCHQCGNSYISMSKLKIHTENAHLELRRFPCHLCDKKYKQPTALQTHIRAAHTKERPFHCRFGCGKSFCRSSSLHSHEQMHKMKFRCEICSKDFSFRQNLQTHCRNIHGKFCVDTEKCKIEII